jgi:PilZ domain
MIEHPAQRRDERLTVPRQCRAAGRDGKAMRLLDLSPTGARIEHIEPLRGASSFPMDLPRALGGGRVQVEVIWSRPSGHKSVVEGKPRLVYQSGLAFPHATPEEQAALRLALIRIAGQWALGMLRDLRWQVRREAAHQEWFDSLCDETLGWLGREIGTLRFTKAH